jgi:hypothetical protein
MATRSNITYKGELDGKNGYHTIYVHWDGYPSYRFPLLEENYSDEEKVKELIRLGDVSSLTESIECPDGHCFDKPVKGYSVFYTRDRGETGCMAKFTETLEDALTIKDGSWSYVYDGDLKKWLIYETYSDDGRDIHKDLSFEEAVYIETGE